MECLAGASRKGLRPVAAAQRYPSQRPRTSRVAALNSAPSARTVASFSSTRSSSSSAGARKKGRAQQVRAQQVRASRLAARPVLHAACSSCLGRPCSCRAWLTLGTLAIGPHSFAAARPPLLPVVGWAAGLSCQQRRVRDAVVSSTHLPRGPQPPPPKCSQRRPHAPPSVGQRQQGQREQRSGPHAPTELPSRQGRLFFLSTYAHACMRRVLLGSMRQCPGIPVSAREQM